MRTTFDRLVGPVVVHSREPDPSLATLGGGPRPVLLPTDLGRWKVLAGRRPTPDLRRELAECAGLDEQASAEAASRLGLRGRNPGVEVTRAFGLLLSIRGQLQEIVPLRDPLIVYSPGTDPRPLWKTHVTPEYMARDESDDLADVIAWCLKVIARHPDSPEWSRCARAVGRTWLPGEGVARLYRLVTTSVGGTPRLERAAWVPVFAETLMQSSTTVKDARILWHALALIAPLLLVMAEADDGYSRAGRPPVEVLIETVKAWSDLAREANAWLELVDELAMLDELISERSHLDEKSLAHETADAIKAVRARAMQLYEALPGPNIDLRHRLHDLEAADTVGIRARLTEVLIERLDGAGAGPATPYGTVVGAQGAMLLSVGATLRTGSCIHCGRPTKGGRWRCRLHLQAVWRERKADERSGQRATRRIGRPVKAASTVRRAPSRRSTSGLGRK